MREGWWYFANRVVGDGTETLIAADLPLSNPSITTTLSGTDEVTFDLTPEIMRLKAPDGRPVLRPRATAVYAVLDGVIRGGGLVRSVSADGHTARVVCAGYVSVLDDLPWTSAASKKFYNADPADVIRLIWSFTQSHPHGDLGVAVSAEVKTPVRVGTRVSEVKNAHGEVTTQAVDEPLLLANYATPNLADVFEEMLDVGSIDYRERHVLTGDTVSHELVLGYPRLGRRRTDIQFQVGANVTDIPVVMFDDDDFATEVLVLCAGEGEKMVRAHAYVQDHAPMVRKVATIQQKGIGRAATAQAAAAKYARAMRPDTGDVDSLRVRPHPLAPVGSWENGDEVWLSGDSLWAGQLGQWVRVLETTYNPEEGPGATLKVTRADRT